MKDRVLGHGTTTRKPWQSRPFTGSLKEEKEKEKAKVDSKELVMHTLVKNQHRTLIGGQKKTVFGSPRVKKGKKGSSKG